MKNKKKQELKSKRLILKPLSDDELRDRLESEPDAEMRKALGDMLAGCESEPGSRLWYTEWRAVDRVSCEKVGSLCFKGPPNEQGEAEIGYGIEEAYRGQGYAAESAKALISWAFAQSDGLFFVIAQTEPDNAASRRVLEKLGFSASGRDGEEGPLYELERPASQWLATFMCLGLSIGLCMGSATNVLSVGMCIGLAIGVALGAAMDAEERKKREAIKSAREAAYSGMQNS
jgi:ribosomal-protein-alanine N-acetyltransferase